MRSRNSSLIRTDSEKYEELANIGLRSSPNDFDEEEEQSELEESIQLVREAKKYVTLYIMEKRKVAALEQELESVYQKLTNNAKEVITLQNECDNIAKRYEDNIQQMAKNQRITIERNSNLEIEVRRLKDHISSIEEQQYEEEGENDDMNHLRDQITSLIKEKMELQEQLDDSFEKQKETEDSLSSQAQILKKHFEEALAQNKELALKNQQQASQIQLFGTQVRIAQTQIEQDKSEKDQLNARNAQLLQEIARLKQSSPKNDGATNSNDLSSKIIELSTKNVSLQNENAQLQAKITELQDQIEEKDFGYEEDYESRIETLEKVIENMRDKLNYLENLNKNSPKNGNQSVDQERLKQLEAEHQFCNKEILESKQKTIDNLTQQNEQLQAELEAEKQKNYDLTVEIGELKKRPDAMKSIVKMYTEKYQQAEKARSALQKQLDEMMKH
ncbi:hypothetical protein TVAG_410410 [Trichomonas vaginalis G3]|uniref:Uncharacterized protein n=1 Tax=Trichomonas vaginalis (strain ATCC PRA-98 / G3) TaxID=412133 RepID=A2E8K1_TRIV3|nr:hypothetical protein TVAGG3_0358560 [Trichomonas vaginalis G3]EAY11038.1 hypothetical protein TVAG_410410 [Trichomonas vaginalis G3]KAI5531788.1 hypothetical protein TVAGG3_0358560 [Trichomonas vaginalis G3]|eukprot:XP_001323261.1 hypothetical protein [Trichomonas vaginalis G3]